MALKGYLAMTGAEIWNCRQLPAHLGWFSCHFSNQHRGIGNLPAQLPPGSLLILSDEIPCQGHDPERVVDQLLELQEKTGFEALLLDFQRMENRQTAAVIKAVSQALPCPMAVSQGYADAIDGPVFLPLQGLHRPLTDSLAPWQGRELWLEAGYLQEEIRVTQSGASVSLSSANRQPDEGFVHKALCCRYRIRQQEDGFLFHLWDTPELLKKRLKLAEALGVTTAVGFRWELGDGFFADL